jgi:hypothetical protein
MSYKYKDEYIINNLSSCLHALLMRLEKYIDRRVPDDGPDMEFSKLDDTIQSCKRVLEDVECGGE